MRLRSGPLFSCPEIKMPALQALLLTKTFQSAILRLDNGSIQKIEVLEN
jgi:hypothetical protein